MALQSISSFCGSNPPGLLTIEYAPLRWIDTDVYIRRVVAQSWLSSIPFSEGQWLQLPVFAREDHLWTQTQQNSPQGPAFAQVVAGVTPQLRVAVEDQFAQMDREPFILRLTDRNGQQWKLGTVEYPFYFTANASSGSGTQRNQYDIEFRTLTAERAFGLPQ